MEKTGLNKIYDWKVTRTSVHLDTVWWSSEINNHLATTCMQDIVIDVFLSINHAGSFFYFILYMKNPRIFPISALTSKELGSYHSHLYNKKIAEHTENPWLVLDPSENWGKLPRQTAIVKYGEIDECRESQLRSAYLEP